MRTERCCVFFEKIYYSRDSRNEFPSTLENTHEMNTASVIFMAIPQNLLENEPFEHACGSVSGTWEDFRFSVLIFDVCGIFRALESW